jgi:uncharacterized cupin superfamily protein
MTPVINLADVTFDDVEENGRYTSRRAMFSGAIGARQLGYNLTELPPGKAQCPFHNHHAEEEMFLVLSGEGTLRYGTETHALKPMDVVACPTGGRETAHHITNTGTETLRYLAVSTLAPVEVCGYPDSDKVGFYSASGAGGVFRAGDAAGYYEGEDT